MTAYIGTLPTPMATPFLAEHAQEIINALHGLADTWTTYTPVWTASGTDPVLGNGTIEGFYHQVNKWVEFLIILTMGSTTTFGTNSWEFTLPTPKPVRSNITGSCLLVDNTAASGWIGMYRAGGGGDIYRIHTHTGANVSASHPFVWATSDGVVISGSYETA